MEDIIGLIASVVPAILICVISIVKQSAKKKKKQTSRQEHLQKKSGENWDEISAMLNSIAEKMEIEQPAPTAAPAEKPVIEQPVPTPVFTESKPILSEGESRTDEDGCVGGSMDDHEEEGETLAEHTAHLPDMPVARAPVSRRVTTADLRRAVVMSEILNRPVALRK